MSQEKFILMETVNHMFRERCKTHPNLTAFHIPYGEGWKSMTFGEYYEKVKFLAHGLMDLGLEKGNKVSLISSTRFEWQLADMSIVANLGVTVPIYATLPGPDSELIYDHSESQFVFVENELQLKKVLEFKNQPKSIICFESSAVAAAAGKPHVISLDAVLEKGRDHFQRNRTLFEETLLSAKKEEVFTICYTSGTTGVPKGVILTHDNLVSVLEDVVEVLERSHQIRPCEETTVTFLPYSHILGRVESMSSYTFGWQAYFAKDMDSIIPAMLHARPTLMFAVPRLFEKAYAKIQNGLADASSLKKKLFSWAMGVGASGRSKLSLSYLAADKLVLSKIRARLGGQLKYAICGGAPLPQDIGEFFSACGINLLEGYGLTETCAPVAVNTPDFTRFGTVGKPLPECSIKIAEDGEILVQSRKVFKGYYKMDDATREVLSEDGWFHTGDIGHIDAQGFLKITDRKKEIIVTSGGKNIAPQKIENLAKKQPLINQFVVHGDKRNFLSALITLDEERIEAFAKQEHILFSEYAELIKHPKIHKLVEGIVDEINEPLASFERIKRFVLLPREFTVDSGEITPSLKVKRRVVEKRYAQELDSLYEVAST